MTDTNLAALADRMAIRELVEAYGDAVAMRDAAAWGATWTDDAAWHIAGTSVSGRAAIVAHWQMLMDGFAHTDFVMTPGPIVVTGDRATLRVHVAEELWDHAGARISLRGRYDDVAVRTADGWRFASRTYTIIRQF